MWYFRINDGPPKRMSYEYDRGVRTWYKGEFKAKEAKEITVYYDGIDMKAAKLYEIKIKIPYFDSWQLGTVDVHQKVMTAAMPPLLSKCKKDAQATVEVSEIEPPLAYKTAGENFEKFLGEIMDRWRIHAMGMVKEGMEKNCIDHNKRIGAGDMRKVVKCLHDHMKSIEATKEFDQSFKAIKQ
eukprot:UN06012